MAQMKPGSFRFTNKDILPWLYRQEFLYHTEQEAPEVLESLKKLCPRYDSVINQYPFTETLIDFLNGEDEITPLDDTFRREILDYHLVVKDRYKGSALQEAEESAWKRCIELREGYAEFLETFGLTTEWLRSGLFRLLGNLVRSPHDFNSLRYAYSHASFRAHGADLEFQLDGWKIVESMQDFDLRARTAFELQLELVKSETINYFQRKGYKKQTKPLAVAPVKWLVWWTVKRIGKFEILERIDQDSEFSGRSPDLKTLEYHFRQLRKKYDLPVRKVKNLSVK